MNAQFIGKENINVQFMQAPSFLFSDESYRTLSHTAKLLYILLINRARLSQNNNWIDDDDNVFVFFTVEETCKVLNISSQTAVKTFAALESFGLIKRVRRGFGKPSVIKITEVNSFNKYNSKNQNSQKSKNQKTNKSKNQNSKIIDFNNQDYQKIEPINNNINKNKSSNNNISHNKDEEVKKIKEKIAFDFLVDNGYNKELLNLSADILYDIFFTDKSYRINGGNVSAREARSRLKDYDEEIAEYVVTRVEDELEKREIKNLRAYVTACLYNAPLTKDVYYEKLAREAQIKKEQKPPRKDPYATDLDFYSRIL